MSGPAATLLFSTYNGSKSLPAMLDALCAQTLPRDQWKIVAVDNNSKDDTRAVLEAYGERLPLDIHSELRQGKEHALARGFQHLEGDLVILSDDDVIPEPDWIEQFVKLAARQPDYDIFGGLILPAWEQAPEPWLLGLSAEQLGILYAINDGVEEGPVPAGLIFGPNSAFRRSVIGDSYAVQNVGPNASVAQYPMGQDTAFALAIERKGSKAFHSRAPRLRHMVRANSMSEAWVLRRAERFGMGMVAIHPEFFDRKSKIAGLPVSTVALWAAMSVATRVPGLLPSRRRFDQLWKQAVRQGILRQFASKRTADRTPAAAGVVASE